MQLPDKITIYEVGPRDGFQNVARFVPTDVKVAFVNALTEAGLPVVEVTSFVSPKWVPQLSDAAAVLTSIHRAEGVRYPVLVPNEIGFDNAVQAGADEIAVFTAASEAFNRRNINVTIDESIERFGPVVRRALERGMRVRGYVSTAFGCPYQGAVPLEDVLRVTEELFRLGCAEVSVGDTIGVADPHQVATACEAFAQRFDLSAIALHLHDTYGRGLANVLAGLEGGISTFDASAGGLGGCPYARGATGNLATEDLVAMLDRMGVETGVDVQKVVEASTELQRATGLYLPSRAYTALRNRRRPVRVHA